MDKQEFCTDLKMMLTSHRSALAALDRYLSLEQSMSEIGQIKILADSIENQFGQIFKKFKAEEMMQLYMLSNPGKERHELDTLVWETHMYPDKRMVHRDHFNVGSEIKKLPKNLMLGELVIERDAILEELPDDIIVNGLSLHKKDKVLERQCQDLKTKGQIKVLEIF